ncbi:ribonucleoside-diphosphate reductase subunit alpha [Puniceicoccus vermicola]|uniref:Ribonucleoside-diphosphate reductase n=1 Tax=Puniceicoccus vermicola TaxID=388746 RepID=A0A7X1E6A1_9BACT|nr:ribonucleoside-diphosphate reductase subunit alpha [Puniceicoccus vermicola]MBC2602467.1 ribonucleoside-diphosphate reductase subunit alpha [Puniceicoccus vermicola]
MISRITIEEDKELKRFARAPLEEKPRYDWRALVPDDSDLRPAVKIQDGADLRDFNLAEIADWVGEALTNLLLSRQEEDIFTDKNKNFVALVAKEVGERLQLQSAAGRKLALSPNDVSLLVEKALIELEAHDVAKSFVFSRIVHHDDHGNGSDEEFSPELARLRLIRRNGQVVPWNRNKIEVAVRKSFLSLELDSDSAVDVSRGVTERILALGQAFVNIEDVQDIVQEELMRQGHFKVAEAYILYRAYRARQRVEENSTEATDEKQDAMIVVRKEDGDSFFWDGLDLKKRIEFGMIGLDLGLDAEEIETELRRSVYPEMKEADLRKTIILNAKSMIERDADFSRFAGRILLTYIYEEVLQWDIVKDGITALKEAHVKAFRRYLRRGVEIERLNPKLLEYDVETLGAALDPSADMDFDYLGVQTLYDRYLIIDKKAAKKARLETPQFFWMRVAMGLFIGEEDSREPRIIELYGLYKNRRFCSSTPTLFNSGTLHSQLSSCYLYKVDDSIESIMMRGIAENAFLSKWAGGLGGSWTSVRGTGSYIKGTNGESQGVIPFLKLHNDQLVAVNQGGKRRGSGCAYLETWHNDLFDFIELRKNVGDDRRRTHDMNTANWIPDLFMKRMEERGTWTFFQSNEVPELHDLYGKAFEERYVQYERMAEAGEISGTKVEAIEVWKRMLKMLFETGHPWITFKDPCNIRSPQDHVGVIHSSNLCTEITLNTSEDETAVCNLGSVVLDSHLDDDGNLDLEKLRDTVRTAVRALDNVIDINFYPTKAAETSNRRHRPIGLGIMGLQNALFKRNQPFESQEAIEFNDEFMEAIAFYAYEASSDLAAERGTYSTFKGSKWDRGLLPQDTLKLLEEERGIELDIPHGGRLDWKPLREKIAKQGMRNSNVLAIAPTATISNIMGTSPCIEPTYKNLFVKSNLSGDFVVLNGALVRALKDRGLWNKETRDQLKYFDGELASVDGMPDDLQSLFKTAFGVPYQAFIDAAARRQKWIDQSQSVNLFLASPDLKTLSHMYRAAWRKGLKTTYYLRSLGASNIEKATVSVKKEVRGHAGKKEFTAEEKAACSLEAMMNGEECEACQ